jgi:hypothetical protein
MVLCATGTVLEEVCRSSSRVEVQADRRPAAAKANKTVLFIDEAVIM